MRVGVLQGQGLQEVPVARQCQLITLQLLAFLTLYLVKMVQQEVQQAQGEISLHHQQHFFLVVLAVLGQQQALGAQ
jgi:hypothetical protein